MIKDIKAELRDYAQRHGHSVKFYVKNYRNGDLFIGYEGELLYYHLEEFILQLQEIYKFRDFSIHIKPENVEELEENFYFWEK